MDYLHRFAHLHTATSRVHWTAATTYRAPNKPLLLLAVFDLCAQGGLTTNLVTLTPELGELFAGYWARVMPADRHGNLAMPFFHLRHDGFWHLVPAPGQETGLAALTTATSVSQLRTLVLGARLDDELYDLMRIEATRDQLRTVLIQTYFAPELRSSLLEQGLTNLETFHYSQELLVSAHSQPLRETADIAAHYRPGAGAGNMFGKIAQFSASTTPKTFPAPAPACAIKAFAASSSPPTTTAVRSAVSAC